MTDILHDPGRQKAGRVDRGCPTTMRSIPKTQVEKPKATPAKPTKPGPARKAGSDGIGQGNRSLAASPVKPSLPLCPPVR